MRLLVVYATTEGQTEKICQFAAETLRARGHEVRLSRAETSPSMEGVEAAILAGSVHVRAIQIDLRDYAKAHADALNAIPTLYLQVSLAAAGDDPEELADLDLLAHEFSAATGWVPDRTEQVAGAFRFTQYDFFKSWAMRWIAYSKGEKVDPHKDKEYTDWTALRHVLEEWIGGLT